MKNVVEVNFEAGGTWAYHHRVLRRERCHQFRTMICTFENVLYFSLKIPFIVQFDITSLF